MTDEACPKCGRMWPGFIGPIWKRDWLGREWLEYRCATCGYPRWEPTQDQAAVEARRLREEQAWIAGMRDHYAAERAAAAAAALRVGTVLRRWWAWLRRRGRPSGSVSV